MYYNIKPFQLPNPYTDRKDKIMMEKKNDIFNKTYEPKNKSLSIQTQKNQTPNIMNCQSISHQKKSPVSFYSSERSFVDNLSENLQEGLLNVQPNLSLCKNLQQNNHQCLKTMNFQTKSKVDYNYDNSQSTKATQNFFKEVPLSKLKSEQNFYHISKKENMKFYSKKFNKQELPIKNNSQMFNKQRKHSENKDIGFINYTEVDDEIKYDQQNQINDVLIELANSKTKLAEFQHQNDELQLELKNKTNLINSLKENLYQKEIQNLKINQSHQKLCETIQQNQEYIQYLKESNQKMVNSITNLMNIKIFIK